MRQSRSSGAIPTEGPAAGIEQPVRPQASEGADVIGPVGKTLLPEKMDLQPALRARFRLLGEGWTIPTDPAYLQTAALGPQPVAHSFGCACVRSDPVGGAGGDAEGGSVGMTHWMRTPSVID